MMDDYADLAGMPCEACHAGSPLLTEEELAALLPRIPEWDVVEIDAVPRLVRVFRLKGWMPGVRFANELAAAAEETDHHPVITLDWGQITVAWWTHAIRGLHKNDIIMAAKTDEIWSRYGQGRP